MDAEEAAFSPEEVNGAVKDCIESVLAGQAYNEDKVSAWTNQCLEGCMKRLTALGKPYKYVATCIIMQKTGAGLHTAASCFWDGEVDGSRTVRWESKSMYAVVTVFGLAL